MSVNRVFQLSRVKIVKFVKFTHEWELLHENDDICWIIIKIICLLLAHTFEEIKKFESSLIEGESQEENFLV